MDDGEEQKLRKAIQNLLYWQQGQTFFTCELYELIAKADPFRRARIEIGFPIEVKAFELWRAAPDPELFFKQWLA